MDFFRTLVTHPHATQYYQAEDQRPCEYSNNIFAALWLTLVDSHPVVAQQHLRCRVTSAQSIYDIKVANHPICNVSLTSVQIRRQSVSVLAWSSHCSRDIFGSVATLSRTQSGWCTHTIGTHHSVVRVRIYSIYNSVRVCINSRQLRHTVYFTRGTRWR